ncbi:hypothetical protein D3C71_1587950 [compost metagenome]
MTAINSIVVLLKEDFTPSGFCSLRCKCGIKLSNTNRNTPPNKNPIAAGTQLIFPADSDISIAGISSDHTDAAIIIPAANPRKNL